MKTAESVRCSRPSGSVRKELCSSTAAATAGCAIWRRSARGPPRKRTLSRSIVHVMLSGPKRPRASLAIASVRLVREGEVGEVFAEVAHALHLHAIGCDRVDEVVEEHAALHERVGVRPPRAAVGALLPVIDAAETLEAVLD